MRAAQHLHADNVLVHVGYAPLQLCFTHEAQKGPELLRAVKRAAQKHPLEGGLLFFRGACGRFGHEITDTILTLYPVRNEIRNRYESGFKP